MVTRILRKVELATNIRPNGTPLIMTYLKGGWGLRLLVDLGVFEAEEDAPDEAAEEADSR